MVATTMPTEVTTVNVLATMKAAEWRMVARGKW